MNDFVLGYVNYYLAGSLMKRNQKTYSFFQLASAVFMILALLWLTVSTPFVYDNQQKQSQQAKMFSSQSSPIDNSEEESNPFSNTTEEKNPNSNAATEEYLHSHHIVDHFFFIASQNYKCEDAGTYIAFHGELLVPPPDVA